MDSERNSANSYESIEVVIPLATDDHIRKRLEGGRLMLGATVILSIKQ